MTHPMEPRTLVRPAIAALAVSVGLVTASVLVPRSWALPDGPFDILSFEAGVEAASDLGDDRSARADALLAGGWIGAVLGVRERVERSRRDDIEDARNLISDTPESRKVRRVEIRRVTLVYRRLLAFNSRLEKLDRLVDAAAEIDTDARVIAAVTKAAKKASRAEFLGYLETHAAWDHLVGGLDDAVLTLIQRIDADEGRLAAVAGAAETKSGKKALVLLQLIDELSTQGLADRAEIALLDDEPISNPIKTAPTKEEKAVAKGLKREVTQYGSYAKLLERLARKLSKLVDDAIDMAGGAGPGEDCEFTFEGDNFSGGGWIEVTVDGGGTRSYPVITQFDPRAPNGTATVRAYSDGGSYEGDVLVLALNDTARSGEGTYQFLMDGEQDTPGKARFVFDTRGPDGDPFPENNTSFFDYERDVLSGTVTITKIDLTKAGREMSGTFTLETAFLDNPDEHRAEATITGRFHCCRFAVVNPDGSFDLAE